MIEAIQVAADAAQANPAASPAAQPQATMFEVNQFAQAYGRGGSSTGGAEAVAAPAQPSEGMRVLLSTFENLNAGADKISAMSHALTSSGSDPTPGQLLRSAEHTSELQSLMRISYAVFCLKNKNN